MEKIQLAGETKTTERHLDISNKNGGSTLQFPFHLSFFSFEDDSNFDNQ